MLAAAALLLFAQYNTARPAEPAPLEAGRWVLRESSELGTGLGGVSATLVSNDGEYRLVIRCDYGHDSDISLQFLRNQRGSGPTALPMQLMLQDGEDVPLDWEQTPFGIFARDGADSNEATHAAARLQTYTGPISAQAHDARGRRIRAQFDAGSGQLSISRTISACFDT